MFEADVLDHGRNLIGKVRGPRAEGFGTSVSQTRWKDMGDDLNAPGRKYSIGRATLYIAEPVAALTRRGVRGIKALLRRIPGAR